MTTFSATKLDSKTLEELRELQLALSIAFDSIANGLALYHHRRKYHAVSDAIERKLSERF